MTIGKMNPDIAANVLPSVLRTALLGLGVAFVGRGTLASWGAVKSLWALRRLRLGGGPAQRLLREDEARDAYWLEFFATLNAIAGGALLVSGTGLLWLRSRCRR